MPNTHKPTQDPKVRKERARRRLRKLREANMLKGFAGDPGPFDATKRRKRKKKS